MKKRTTKKLSKASRLKLGTQEVADRANRGGVQIQSSYRSREKSEETTDLATTGEMTEKEMLSLMPKLSPDDPIYKTGLRIGGWYTKRSSRARKPENSQDRPSSTNPKSELLANRTSSNPEKRLPHQYPWIDFDEQ